MTNARKRATPRPLMLLSVLLAIALLVGCAPSGVPVTSGETAPSSTAKQEPLTPSSTIKDDPTTPSSTVEDDPTTSSSTIKDEPTTPSTNGDDPALDIGFAPDEQLVNELIQFIQKSEGQTSSTLSCKLKQISTGRQALYVKFSATSYYFVCAYAENASCDLSDPDQCTWVAFKTESAIPETYQGRKFIRAFQINRAEHCWDIADETKTRVPLEHYKVYTAHFKDGYNTYSARIFEEAFIYSKKDDQYCSVDHPDHEKYDIPCVEINGQAYLLQKVELKDTELVVSDLKKELGRYYGNFMRLKQEYLYTVDRKNTPRSSSRTWLLCWTLSLPRAAVCRTRSC